jgi:hypothetical protein
MKPDAHAASASAGILGRVAWWAGRAEDAILATALFLMAVIPVVELVGRSWFSAGIAGATEYLQHLTLL